ncbi:hypothetical protein VYU27_001935 [Nannochloropsis oceanica]
MPHTTTTGSIMRRALAQIARPALAAAAGAAKAARSSNSIRSTLVLLSHRRASTLRTTSISSSTNGSMTLLALQHLQSFAQRRTMFIQTESTPNPESLKYVPGEVVLDEKYGTGMYFRQGDTEVNRSPLAKKLLKIGGVQGVFLGRTFITITKSPEIIWQNLNPEIFATVMDHYAEGGVIVSDHAIISDTTILDTDDDVVAMIKELMESRIRPAVQEDGGDIFYEGFDIETGVVSVRLAGSCSGCPSSSVTLKNGVENMLMHYIPEVKGIQQVEDDELKEVNEKEVETLEQRLAKAGIPSAE